MGKVNKITFIMHFFWRINYFFVIGVNRCLTIYKPNSNTFISYDATLELTNESTTVIRQFLQQNRISDREMSEAQELGLSKIPKKYYYAFAIFKLSIPPRITISHDIVETHVKLPITNYRQHIVDMINNNKVIVIAGDTGSGSKCWKLICVFRY